MQMVQVGLEKKFKSFVSESHKHSNRKENGDVKENFEGENILNAQRLCKSKICL